MKLFVMVLESSKEYNKPELINSNYKQFQLVKVETNETRILPMKLASMLWHSSAVQRGMLLPSLCSNVNDILRTHINSIT